MDCYDQLAPFYHLVHQDWSASVLRQGNQGYSVTASDVSTREIDRARQEAGKRGLDVGFSVCDVRQAHTHHGSGFDVVISCDNSLPHLLTDEELLIALKQMLACLAVGGGCIVTVRDYALEERGRNLVKPYGVRIEDGKRYLLFQVWDFEGEHYDLTFFFVEEDLASHEVKSHVMRTRYHAVSTDRLTELMREAGFAKPVASKVPSINPFLWAREPLRLRSSIHPAALT